MTQQESGTKLSRNDEGGQDTGSLGSRLRSARGSRKLTEVEEDTGIPKSTLGTWESDTHKPPLLKAALLAEHYGVSLDWLVSGNKKPRPDEQTEAGEGRYVMNPDGTMRLVKPGEVPEHAVVKFIGLSVNGQLQVALDLLIHGRPERANVEVDVSDLKLKSDS